MIGSARSGLEVENDTPTVSSKDEAIITEADTQGYLRAHIVLPSLIYGVASHALVHAGVSHSTSIQIPTLIRAALDRGQAGMIGQGKSLWPDVHIDDSECPPSSLQLTQAAQSFETSL